MKYLGLPFPGAGFLGLFSLNTFSLLGVSIFLSLFLVVGFLLLADYLIDCGFDLLRGENPFFKPADFEEFKHDILVQIRPSWYLEPKSISTLFPSVPKEIQQIVERKDFESEKFISFLKEEFEKREERRKALSLSVNERVFVGLFLFSIGLVVLVSPFLILGELISEEKRYEKKK